MIHPTCYLLLTTELLDLTDKQIIEIKIYSVVAASPHSLCSP